MDLLMKDYSDLSEEYFELEFERCLDIYDFTAILCDLVYAFTLGSIVVHRQWFNDNVGKPMKVIVEGNCEKHYYFITTKYGDSEGVSVEEFSFVDNILKSVDSIT